MLAGYISGLLHGPLAAWSIQYMRDGLHQIDGFKGLEKDTVDAMTVKPRNYRCRAFSGHSDYGLARISRLYLQSKRPAIHFGHIDVGQYKINAIIDFQTPERFFATIGRGCSETEFFKELANHCQRAFFIVYDQSVSFGLHHNKLVPTAFWI